MSSIELNESIDIGIYLYYDIVNKQCNGLIYENRRSVMEKKKYVFVLSHATTNPMEVLGIVKIASNMKAFDESIDVVIFLIGEGVQLAKKGVAETISIEFEGIKVNLGEMIELIKGLGVKFYVCRAFMPGFELTEKDLIENAEVRTSSYLGELFLEGYIPFSLNI
jgi:predicted peroxiredoxin